MTKEMNSSMTLKQLYDCVFRGAELNVTPQQMAEVEASYRFLEDFSRQKVIYGINTGFGPMAQWRVDDNYLKDLQYNIIRSHSTGMGEPLSAVDTKSAMIARLGTFLCAKSGIHPEVVELLKNMVNRDILPFIPCHGSVGASGDLVQLAHMGLAMIGEGYVRYKGEWKETAEVFAEEGLKPISIHVREGLSTTNGTSVMTGILSVCLAQARSLIDLAVRSGAWINEVAGSFDDYMSEELNEARPHPGQIEIAAALRKASAGSQLLMSREHELYDPAKNRAGYFDHKVQAYYSLRCLPQILGPVLDTVRNAEEVVETELNSACDNPVVDYKSQNVYHGGNFHGDYISLEADKVKIALTRLVMTAERQLNYLYHDRINGILPPFLNMGTLGLNYGMQACQFTATSTTAECQTLSMPNYVHSIPNNNDNQDIVSMGTNSALLCRRVIDNAYQVISILMMSLAQATDCLGVKDKLSPEARRVYDEIRAICPPVKDHDGPFYIILAEIEKKLRENLPGTYRPTIPQR